MLFHIHNIPDRQIVPAKVIVIVIAGFEVFKYEQLFCPQGAPRVESKYHHIIMY